VPECHPGTRDATTSRSLFEIHLIVYPRFYFCGCGFQNLPSRLSRSLRLEDKEPLPPPLSLSSNRNAAGLIRVCAAYLAPPTSNLLLPNPCATAHFRSLILRDKSRSPKLESFDFFSTSRAIHTSKLLHCHVCGRSFPKQHSFERRKPHIWRTAADIEPTAVH
jgi:hypothetical protein